MRITHSLSCNPDIEKYIEVDASRPSYLRFVTETRATTKVEPWLVLTRTEAKHLAHAIIRILNLTKRHGTRRSNQAGTGNS